MLTKKFCPKCGSENVFMIAGGITGGWICGNCGYSGIFPEKTLIAEDEIDEKKMKRDKKK